MFALQDAIYLIELAFYGPILPAIIFILFNHGFKKPYTWRPIIIPLILLSGLRIAGASLGLTSMNPDKASLLNTATLLDTIGLAPVLCLLISLLIRANSPLPKGLPFWSFLPLNLIIVGATIMTAYGGRDLYSAHDHKDQDMRLMRAGIFLFIATFTITVILAVVSLLKVREPRFGTERAAAVCAILVVPFMTVRLAFSTGSLFSGNDSVLNPMSGDDTGVWLHFVMVVVMEYTVALATTAVALDARRAVVVDDKVEKGDEV